MTKKVSFKPKDVTRPPRGARWVWHTVDIVTTDKWRKMPLCARRLLERIEVEHMAHAGQENGRLGIAYSQFVEWGLSRRSIPAAIRYAEDAGFLEVTERGYHLKDTTNLYRLTYYATRELVRGVAYEWSAPTNEWKRRAGKSFFSRAACDTHLGQNVTLTGSARTANPAESLRRGVGQNVTPSNISSGRPATPVQLPTASEPQPRVAGARR